MANDLEESSKHVFASLPTASMPKADVFKATELKDDIMKKDGLETDGPNIATLRQNEMYRYITNKYKYLILCFFRIPIS